MLARLESQARAMREIAQGCDASALSGAEAARAVELLCEIEKLAGAVRALASARVAATRAWRVSGASSAAGWVAARAGTTLTAAGASLQAAAALDALPATRAAVLAGRLSQQQVAEVTAAASADPAAEAMLLELAQRETVAALKERCRDVIAAACGDEDATERIRRSRYFRSWTERDGAVRMDARLAADDAAPLLAAVRARADEIEREARRAGQTEKGEAYAADALCSLADGAGAPRAVVRVIVSDSALARGSTVAGETCTIDGVGPVSVGAAMRFARRGSVTIVDAERISHLGRPIPAPLKSALEARDPVCVVPGCNRRRGLEMDHVVPVAAGGETSLKNLARLCRWHHAQKTHRGWRLSGEPGRWEWCRPGRARARGPDSS